MPVVVFCYVDQVLIKKYQAQFTAPLLLGNNSLKRTQFLNAVRSEFRIRIYNQATDFGGIWSQFPRDVKPTVLRTSGSVPIGAAYSESS
jgi:hypothetical protein